MASPGDETAGSTTAGVGEKHNFQEPSPGYREIIIIDSSDEESAQPSQKRVKHNPEVGWSSSYGTPFLEAVIKANSPPSGDESAPSNALEASQFSAPIQLPSVPAPSTWNQGVQSGLRTSFASRSKASLQPLGSQSLESDQPLCSLSRLIPAATPAPAPTHRAEDREDRHSHVPNNRVAIISATEQAQPPKIGQSMKKKQANKRKMSNTDDKLEENRPAKKTNKEAVTVPKVMLKSLANFKTSGPAASYSNYLGKFKIAQIFQNGTPLTLEQLNFGMFVTLFLRDNLDKINYPLTPKILGGAFGTYLTQYHIKDKFQVRDKVRATAKGAYARQLVDKILAAIRNEMIEEANPPLPQVALPFASNKSHDRSYLDHGDEAVSSLNVLQFPKHQTPHISLNDEESHFGTNPAKEKGLVISDEVGSIGLPKITLPKNSVDHNVPVLTTEQISATRMSHSTAAVIDQNDVTSADGMPPDYEASGIVSNLVAVHTGPEDISYISKAELALQEKYFPTPSGNPIVVRCLACASSGHKTSGCPALNCSICGVIGNHSTFTCPQNQLCGKCRGRGHGIVDCPEKLFLSQGEFLGCDICDAQDHLAFSCPLIWRSFNPKPEEIRKVREIPIHCYSCGAGGHYGPECGLHSTRILSGDRTWSRANVHRYIDPSSEDRAVSAGVDYSIPSKSRQEFNIKGKAIDTITEDDSDDNVAHFIRPKARGSLPDRAHIRFGNYTNENYSRQPNPPRAARPIWPSQLGDNSARHAPERTFSPTPKYDGHKADLSQYLYTQQPRPMDPFAPPNSGSAQSSSMSGSGLQASSAGSDGRNGGLGGGAGGGNASGGAGFTRKPKTTRKQRARIAREKAALGLS